MQTQNEINLLKSIKSIISELHNTNDAALCYLWLTKIGEIVNQETKNDYLKRLRDNIVNSELKYPFCESPPDGPLAQIFLDGQLTSKQSTIPTELQDLETLVLSTPGYDYLPRNEVEKYKERSRKYKSEIAKYQNILRSAFKSANLKHEKESNSLPRTEHELTCRCDDLDLLTQNLNGPRNLAEINKKLSNENKHLQEECLKLGHTIKKFNDTDPCVKESKKKREQKINKKLEKSFQVQVKSIIDEKDEMIRNLEEKLNSKTLNNNNSEILQTLEAKSEVLEKRYIKMLDSVIEKHKKETSENRKKIENLENLLIAKNKIGKQYN